MCGLCEKKAYAKKAVVTFFLLHNETNNYVTILESKLFKVVSNVPMFDIFMIEGWPLPVKNTFTYTYKEKSLLYKYFIEGEGTGKNLSPQAIHSLLRKTVQSYEYFTTQQFYSLYST